MNQYRRLTGEDVVGVEGVDGQVVGDHCSGVVVYRRDGDMDTVAGLELVSDMSWSTRVQTWVVASQYKRAHRGGDGGRPMSAR